MSPNADMTGLPAGDRTPAGTRLDRAAARAEPRHRLILLNAALLGLETSAGAMAAAGGLIVGLDRAILAVFVVEIALRLYAHRAAFWRDPWSVFDFAVVAIALIPATGPLSVLRALRVLRVLRLLTMVPSMRRVVGALLAAIPGLGSIVLVLLIIYYVFAVIATNLFAAAHPEWFGDIGRSLYTLFQIMTLESWSMGIARPVMEHFPYAWTFLHPLHPGGDLHHAQPVHRHHRQRHAKLPRGRAARRERGRGSGAQAHRGRPARRDAQLREDIRELKALLPAAGTAPR
jgi:hypothetical protein